MADNTHIEWTQATWNIITGCTVHSPGCTNCYAMKLAGTRLAHHESRAGLTTDNKAGPVWNGQVRFNEQWLDQPLRWKRPRMIFVCAHGDLFHESVPDAWIDRVFAVMALCPQHTFQVLTKRSDRMREYLSNPDLRRRLDYIINAWGDAVGPHAKVRRAASYRLQALPLPNVWLGVSVEDQARADQRIPDLLATPAAVRWLSCEPLLGPVNLKRLTDPADQSFYIDAMTGDAWDDVNGGLNQEIWGADDGPKLDWIVAGGESGPGARPMHPDWARSLRDQCAAADVPFFFKQWGEWGHAFHLAGCVGVSAALTGTGHWPDPKHYRVIGGELEGRSFESHPNDHLLLRLGKKRARRLLDGQLHDAMPGVAA